MLGEAVLIDGGALVFLVIILLVTVAAVVATIIAGCVLAFRAGKGSNNALGGWLVIAGIEGLVVLAGIPIILNGNIDVVFVVPAVALLVQVALFLRARR